MPIHRWVFAFCVQFSHRMSTIYAWTSLLTPSNQNDWDQCVYIANAIDSTKIMPLDPGCRIWDIYLFMESVVSVCGRFFPSPSFVISGMRFVRHWFKLISAIEQLKWLNARIVWCAEEKNPGNNWAVVRVMAFIESPCWSELKNILYTRQSTLLIENCQLERELKWTRVPAARCRSQLITFHFQKCAQTTLFCRFEHYIVNHIHQRHRRT